MKATPPCFRVQESKVREGTKKGIDDKIRHPTQNSTQVLNDVSCAFEAVKTIWTCVKTVVAGGGTSSFLHRCSTNQLKKLSDVKIRKEDMNKLVMNFLITEGYVEAAEKFRMESGTEPDIDLATITYRMAVKNGSTKW
ncbi:hypothetical protein JHK82_016776 [Glycine max]|nr:hypothetical protein JHK82_016776 [Glycine max]